MNSKGLLTEKVVGTTNGTNKTVYKYGFDQIGNRTQFSSRKAAKEQSILLAYNDLNQIKTASPAKLGMVSMLAGDYQYDVYGNLVSTPKAHYRYNLNNRLVEINQNPSASSHLCGSLSFSYDGNGRRTDKQVFDKDGKLIRHTKFLYSGFKCVAEIDALNNKVLKFNEWYGEQLLGVYNPGNNKQLSVLTDGNKNVIGLMENNGKISARFAYSPFGELLSSQGASAAESSFGFSSEYRDHETGLVYYNFRYFSPELGRWLSRDPIGELGGYNIYGMTQNAPTYLVDMFGLSWTYSTPTNASIKYFQVGTKGEWKGDGEYNKSITTIFSQSITAGTTYSLGYSGSGLSGDFNLTATVTKEVTIQETATRKAAIQALKFEHEKWQMKYQTATDSAWCGGADTAKTCPSGYTQKSFSNIFCHCTTVCEKTYKGTLLATGVWRTTSESKWRAGSYGTHTSRKSLIGTINDDLIQDLKSLVGAQL